MERIEEVQPFLKVTIGLSMYITSQLTDRAATEGRPYKRVRTKWGSPPVRAAQLLKEKIQ